MQTLGIHYCLLNSEAHLDIQNRSTWAGKLKPFFLGLYFHIFHDIIYGQWVIIQERVMSLIQANKHDICGISKVMLDNGCSWIKMRCSKCHFDVCPSIKLRPMFGRPADFWGFQKEQSAAPHLTHSFIIINVQLFHYQPILLYSHQTI